MIKELKENNKSKAVLSSFSSIPKKIITSSCVSSTAFFYEYILRFYLLLKLNYSNVMQVPKMNRILIFVTGVPLNDVRKISLGLETLTGQKAFYSILSPSQNVRFVSIGSAKERKQKTKTLSAHKIISQKPALYGKSSFRRFDSEFDSALVYCSLRNKAMYNLLEKLISFRQLKQSSLEMPLNVAVQGVDTIQMKLDSRQIRLFPEIQNHFEFFETLRSIHIKIITSATKREETWFLWTSLQQKDI